MTMIAQEAIGRLIEGASWTERAKSLERLAALFAAGDLDPAERQQAADAFRIVLYDSEPLVRLVLAETVKLSLDLPRDILLALAQDKAMVATPILEHQPLLTEEDLLSIALLESPAHRFAIAGRRPVPPRVTAALCRTGERPVILRLLANDGATLTEECLHALLDRFPGRAELIEAIARRRLLPVSVGSRLLGTARRDDGAKPAPRRVNDRTGSLG